MNLHQRSPKTDSVRIQAKQLVEILISTREE